MIQSGSGSGQNTSHYRLLLSPASLAYGLGGFGVGIGDGERDSLGDRVSSGRSSSLRNRWNNSWEDPARGEAAR